VVHEPPPAVGNDRDAGRPHDAQGCLYRWLLVGKRVRAGHHAHAHAAIGGARHGLRHVSQVELVDRHVKRVARAVDQSDKLLVEPVTGDVAGGKARPRER
jgi:hypothetical protein